MRRLIIVLMMLLLLCSCNQDPTEPIVCEPKIGIYNNGNCSVFYEIIGITEGIRSLDSREYILFPIDKGDSFTIRIYIEEGRAYSLSGSTITQTIKVSGKHEATFTAEKSLNYVQVYGDRVILYQADSSMDRDYRETIIN